MDTEKKKVRISVRTLVEFILRSGDLDNRRGGWADKEAMQAGSRIHRKIQGRFGSDYKAEVPLKYEIEYEKYILSVEGRADGIRIGSDPEIIEIKGIYADVHKLTEPVAVHLAQAKCYACIYAAQNGLDQIGIRMSYVNLETEREKDFTETYTAEALNTWFAELILAYSKWAEFAVDWEKKRNASTLDLEFPFPYRKGQRELVVDIYKTIMNEKQLFAQAPTGIGKTMSAVFPAVRALGAEKAEKLFYLTAKTITRTVAEEAVSVLGEKGLLLKSLTLTAKEKICVAEEPDCNPDKCPRAAGHFDRINNALYEMLTTQDVFGRDAVLAQAEKWNVCPHELQLDLSMFADMVICDYNYVFDPTARLKRFFGEGTKKGSYVFLIDEAHNLVERGRDMYSAEICKEEILQLRKNLKSFGDSLDEERDGGQLKAEVDRTRKALAKCNKQMLLLKEDCPGFSELDTAGDLVNRLLSLTGSMEDLLADLKDGEIRKNVLELYFKAMAFTSIYDILDDSYVITERIEDDGRFLVKLFCVNPASNLQRCLDRGKSTVFFSATLFPLSYYRSLLTTREDNYAAYIQSPFSPEKRCILVGRDVSSLYKRRTYEEFVRYASYIQVITARKKGNYMVFFPSYRMMNDVCEVYRDVFASDSDAEILIQTPNMDEWEREEFLDRFAEKNVSQTIIGFCVMGGIFSEGIDLTGEKLIGALIVGTGLPQIGDERELLKAYYNRNDLDGFQYAYLYPGMNKVLQAAGRVIRTVDDCGVIALLDERFGRPDYRSLFPPEWEDRQYMTLATAPAALDTFWNRVVCADSAGNAGGTDGVDSADDADSADVADYIDSVGNAGEASGADNPHSVGDTDDTDNPHSVGDAYGMIDVDGTHNACSVDK